MDEGRAQDESYWTSRRSRRQLLKIAGVGAAAGTAAVVVGSASPASAADGQAAIIGQTNNSTDGTTFASSAASTAALVGQGDGAGAPGVVGSGNSAPDFKGLGTGRLGLQSTSAAEAVAPTWMPTPGITSGTIVHEFVRGTNGEIWASRGGPNDLNNRWKRLNTVRVDAASGSGGVFVPSRIVDTRASGTPLGAGATRNIKISGTGSGASIIPPDTVAVFGNLTALPASGAGFSTSGYLSLYPEGVARPAPSNLNPVKGAPVASNFFVCGLSSGGELTVFSLLPVHFLIDVFAYVQ